MRMTASSGFKICDTPWVTLRRLARAALHGSLMCYVLVAKLVDLRKQMEDYYEKEHLWKLQEEQDLHNSLANTECDAEMASEGSMWTVQASMDAGAPLVAATVPPPQALDNSQESGSTNINLTELKIMLANPNLHPEDREFTGSVRFKNPKKIVPENGMTAR
jgi:hypothetical protein